MILFAILWACVRPPLPLSQASTCECPTIDVRSERVELFERTVISMVGFDTNGNFTRCLTEQDGEPLSCIPAARRVD